jgi:hypothetical protein
LTNLKNNNPLESTYLKRLLLPINEPEQKEEKTNYKQEIQEIKTATKFKRLQGQSGLDIDKQGEVLLPKSFKPEKEKRTITKPARFRE